MFGRRGQNQRETKSHVNDYCNKRVIVHFDVDAFYVACEREINPTLRNVALAVSQYNPYGDLKETTRDDPARLVVGPSLSTTATEERVKGTNVGINDCNNRNNNNGSLIAVSYEARAFGVRRNDRGLEAVKKCPDLRIVQVPVKRCKADLTIYRNASRRVMTALSDAIRNASVRLYKSLDDESCDVAGRVENIRDTETAWDVVSSGREPASVPLELTRIKVEKASIDEVYIDLTEPAQILTERILERMDEEMTAKSMDSRQKRCPTPLRKIVFDSGAARKTTIGGLESNEIALAINGLSKDDIRRGSSLQVLESESISKSELDDGSQKWWNRPRAQWTRGEILLACGSALAALARDDIYRHFDGSVFTLSGGISHNKTMAKLASGLKKPNRQTLIDPTNGIILQQLFHPLPLGRIRGLGGKFGEEVAATLGVSTVGDIAKLPLSVIAAAFPEQARFLHDVSNGLCTEEVTERTKSKSIGCGKTFRGGLSFHALDQDALKRWISELSHEVMERLEDDKEEHGRFPRRMIVGIHFSTKKGSISKSAPLPSHSFEEYPSIACRLARDIVRGSGKSGGVDNHFAETDSSKVVSMSVSATGFVDIARGGCSIMDAFGRCAVAGGSSSGRERVTTERSRLGGNPEKEVMKCDWSTSALCRSEDDTPGAQMSSHTPQKRGALSKSSAMVGSGERIKMGGKHCFCDPNVEAIPGGGTTAGPRGLGENVRSKEDILIVDSDNRDIPCSQNIGEGSLPDEDDTRVDANDLKGSENSQLKDICMDMDVLSQLPPSLRSEIRTNAFLRSASVGRGSVSSRKRRRQSNGLDIQRFFKDEPDVKAATTTQHRKHIEISSGVFRANGTAVKGKNSREKKKKPKKEFSSSSSLFSSSSSCRSFGSKEKQGYCNLAPEHVDPDVLAELGPEIMNSILSEMSTSGSHGYSDKSLLLRPQIRSDGNKLWVSSKKQQKPFSGLNMTAFFAPKVTKAMK